ncbi:MULTISPECIES: hypothetical protein [unclassified Clostridium]|uniref:hypothetical protein n=1 Tax=unclassified Clostridium TaxID=2614128 RepID=UPI0025BD6F3E|nr:MULTISPECIES: hypothetical protein [unclassified Clostridium]
MKIIKRLTLWMAISLGIQCVGFYYIDNNFLSLESKIKGKKVVEEKVEEKKNKIKIPSDVEKVSVSYDSKYLSYIKNNLLTVVKVQDGQTDEITLEPDAEVSFYKWLPDRNRVLFVEKIVNYGSSKLTLYSYDVKKKDKSLIKEFDWNEESAIVEDIAISTLTGLTYVKIVDSENVSSIYRIDRMGTMTKTYTVPRHISNMELLRREDILLYEGEVYNQVYSSQTSEVLYFPEYERITILGRDDEDKIYIGGLENGLVNKIFYGCITEDTSQWQQIALDVSTENQNIYISAEGNIYIHDKDNKIVREQKSNKETIYEGGFIQFQNNGVVTKSGDNVEIIAYK